MQDRLRQWKTALEEGVSSQEGLLPYINQPCHELTASSYRSVDNTIELVENSRPGDRLVIYGEAGQGKTTLLKQLARSWIKGSNTKLAEKFDYVFLIPLRLVGKISLLNTICDELNLIPASNLVILKKALVRNERKTLFLLDSIEELRGDIVTASNTAIDDLITGRLFTKSTVVVTSRPGSGLKQSQKQITARLRDLRKYEVKKVIKQYFGENKYAVDKVQRSFPAMAYLQKPLNLALFIFIITQNKHLTLSYTQAEFFSLVLQYIMLTFAKKKKLKEFTPKSGSYIVNKAIPRDIRLPFRVIAKKCYEQRKKNNVILHIEDADDLQEFLDFGLFTAGPDINTVLLPHSLFMEYFAAAHLAENPDVWKALFEKIKEKSERESPRSLADVVSPMGLENILRFVIALSPQPQLDQMCLQVGRLFVLEREKIDDCDNYKLINSEYYIQLLRDCCGESEKRLLATALLNAPVRDVRGYRDLEEEDKSHVLLPYLDYKQRVKLLKKIHNLDLSVIDGKSTLSCTGNSSKLGIVGSFVAALVDHYYYVIKADKLDIKAERGRRFNLPASLFTQISGVRQLRLERCRLCEGLPDYMSDVGISATFQHSSPRPTNNSLERVELWDVKGLEHCGVITSCQSQLAIRGVNDVRASTLKKCFPRVSELELGRETAVEYETEEELTSWLSTVQTVKNLGLATEHEGESLRLPHLLDTLAGREELEHLRLHRTMILLNIRYTSETVKQNNTLRRLGLYNCKGDVDLGQLLEVCSRQCPQLKTVYMGNSNLVFDDEKVESIKQLPGLQEFILRGSAVNTLAGRRLDREEMIERLRRMCPSAEVELQDDGEANSEKQELLPDPKMQRLYEEACLSGVRNVRQARLMFIGRFEAGKSSLKRSLLNQDFNPEHEITHGVEGPDGRPDDAVDVHLETARLGSGNWEPVSRNYREDLIRELVKAIQPKTIAKQEPSSDRSHTTDVGHSQKSNQARNEQRLAKQPDQEPHDTTFNPPDLDDADGLTTSETESEQQQASDTVQEKLKPMRREITHQFQSYKDEEHMWLTMWDFAGQHVYYESHQAFLSNMAVYLLVTDIKESLEKPPNKEASENSNTPESAIEFIEFWLNSVHTHLVQREIENDKNQKNSEQDYFPPVIIVCTKTDDMKKSGKEITGAEERKREIDNYILEMRKLLALKPYYGHIKDIIAVSNKDGSNIEDLRQKIVETAETLPYWKTDYPINWLLLLLELKNKANPKQTNTPEGSNKEPDPNKEPVINKAEENKVPVIKRKELLEVASGCTVPEDQVDAFLTFHHNLGDLVYYADEDTRDTIILSPQWLASVLSHVITKDYNYRLRNHKEDESKPGYMELEQGVLSDKTILELLQGSEQLKGCEPRTFIKIMEKFDILMPCKAISETGRISSKYIVPCLLKPKQGKIEGGGSPRFHFKFVPKAVRKDEDLGSFTFLPQGLFHRIVSRCSRVEGWNCPTATVWSDYVKFDVGEFDISLHMVPNGITLSASSFPEQSSGCDHADTLSEVRKSVIKVIDTIIGHPEATFPNLKYVPYLECDCNTTGNKKGKPGYIQILQNTERLKGVAHCQTHRGKRVERKKWNIWFGEQAMDENASRSDSSSKRMSDDDKQLFERSRPDLMHGIYLHSSSLLAQLRARGVITMDNEDVIRAKEGNANQVGELLNTIIRQGDANAMDYFIYALRESGHAAVAATYLRDPRQDNVK